MHYVDKEGYTDTEKTYKDNYWDNCGLFMQRSDGESEVVRAK